MEPLGERIRLPVLRMCKVNLFLFPKCTFLVIETTHSQLLTVNDSLVSEIKINDPVQSLDAILYKQRHLDVLVLEKTHQLLFYDLIVIGAERLSKALELSDSILDQDFCWGSLDQVSHTLQVGHGDLVYLIRIGT